MAIHTGSSATLERLVRLERSNRRWRRGAGLALGTTFAALIALAWAPSQAQGPPQLVLSGPGERRLRIGPDQPGTGIELLDERGGKRASLGFFDAEPALLLYDGALRVRAIVSLAPDRPTVVLLDDNRRQVFHAP